MAEGQEFLAGSAGVGVLGFAAPYGTEVTPVAIVSGSGEGALRGWGPSISACRLHAKLAAQIARMSLPGAWEPGWRPRGEGSKGGCVRMLA